MYGEVDVNGLGIRKVHQDNTLFYMVSNSVGCHSIFMVMQKGYLTHFSPNFFFSFLFFYTIALVTK
jgi:hypothetical protein